MFLALIFSCCLLQGALASPTGAPAAACGTMKPNHGVEPKAGNSPYSITLSSQDIKSNAKVSVTIKGSAANTFKGFLVEARAAGTNAVGTFSASGDAKTITCPGGSNNAATHTSNSAKQSVTVSWSPPTGYNGSVTFHVTVVKVKLEFWVGQKTGAVKVTKA